MATEHRRVSLAFAGSGDTSIDNTKALLNDFLGFGPEDEEGFPEVPPDSELDLHVYLPVTSDHLNDGLETVIDWLDYADLAYDTFVNGSTATRAVKRVTANAENSDKVKNVNEALVRALRGDAEDGAEVYLVLLWGEEGDENAEILLDLASSYDVRALDLTQGLDDLDFGEQPTPHEPEPTKEPEPEPEKPTRRRRTKAKAEPEPEKTPEPKPEKPTEPDLQAQAAQYREALGSAAVAQAVHTLYEALDTFLVDGNEKTQAINRLQEALFWARLCQEKNEAVGGPEKAPEKPQKPATRRRTTKVADPAPKPVKEPEKPEDEESRRGRGRPRKDGTPAQPRTPEQRAITEIWDEDEREWVAAGRGRIPKGIPTRRIDPSTGAVVSEDPV